MYNPARTKPGPIIEAACWAHARRKFFDVWQATKSPVAKEALGRIAAVCAIEDKARFAPVPERVEHRRETAPLLDAFFDWANQIVGKLSGKLALAEAFRYTIKRRLALCRFITNGRLEADSNAAENAMRGIALGRKNGLLAGSDAGGERAAAILSLVQTGPPVRLDQKHCPPKTAQAVFRGLAIVGTSRTGVDHNVVLADNTQTSQCWGSRYAGQA